MLIAHHFLKTLKVLKTFRVWIALSLLLTACVATPTPTPKVYRVGILSGLDFFVSTTEGFKSGMAELGYVEGQNITYDFQKTNFDPAKEEEILNKFVADKVDLIFVFPTEASLEAKAAAAGANIPVLFANANIEDTGLVASASAPGGNITGVRYPGPDIALKEFELMHEIAPDAKRIWIPYQQGYPIVPSELKLIRPAAEAAGVTLIESPLADTAALQAAVETQTQAGEAGPQAILLIPEPLGVTPDNFVILGKFAAERNIPIGGGFNAENYQSIFHVGTNHLDVGKQAAALADKIFKGAPAGDLPVVSAESYMVINYKAAQALGLTVSDGLLNQANEVIR